MPVFENPPAQVSSEFASEKDTQRAGASPNPFTDSLKETYFSREIAMPLRFGDTQMRIGVPREISNGTTSDWDKLSQDGSFSFSGSYRDSAVGRLGGVSSVLASPTTQATGTDPYSAFLAPTAYDRSLLTNLAEQLNIEKFDWSISRAGGRYFDIKGAGFHGSAEKKGDHIRLEGGGEFIEQLVHGLSGQEFKAVNLLAFKDPQGWRFGTSAAYESGPLALTFGTGVSDAFDLVKQGRMLHHTMFSEGEGADILGTKLRLASYDFEKSPGLLSTEIKFGNTAILLANDSSTNMNLIAGRHFGQLEHLFAKPLGYSGEAVYLQHRDQSDQLHQGLGGGVRFWRNDTSGALSLILSGYGTKSDGPEFKSPTNSGARFGGEFSIGLEFIPR